MQLRIANIHKLAERKPLDLKASNTNTTIKSPKRPFYIRRWFISLIVGTCLLLVAGYIGVGAYIAAEFTTGRVHDLGPDTPATYGMQYENITYQTSDKYHIKISGWWIPRPGSDAVLILVHAKDGTRTFLLPFGHQLWQAGYNIIMFDTRGQGQSEGSRYYFGWYEKYDVLGAVDFVKAKGFQPEHIGIVGWSMGAAIALQAMEETPDIRTGVMDASFGNLERAVKANFTANTGLPLWFYPGVKLAALWFDDLDIAKTNPEDGFSKLGNRKIFLIHSNKDEVVPVSEYYSLLKKGGSNIEESWLVYGSKHVRSYQDHTTEYVNRVVSFFNRQFNKESPQ